MANWQLYCATSPSGKRYFGITSKALKVRIVGHRSTHKNYRSIFQKALAKYGDEMIFETMVIGERAYIHELEIKAIEAFQTRDRRYGYNQTFGGETSPMLVPEIRAMAGNGKRGVPLSPEHIEKATRHLLTPEGRAASSSRLTSQRSDPTFAASRLEGIQRSSADPEVRGARQRRGSERFKALNADPEFQAADKARKAARNNDPEFQALATEGLRNAWADPEFRAREGAKIAARWDDPEYRAMMKERKSAAMKARWSAYYADPINCKYPGVPKGYKRK